MIYVVTVCMICYSYPDWKSVLCPHLNCFEQKQKQKTTSVKEFLLPVENVSKNEKDIEFKRQKMLLNSVLGNTLRFAYLYILVIIVSSHY